MGSNPVLAPVYSGTGIHFGAFDRAGYAGGLGYSAGKGTRLADTRTGTGLLEGGIEVVLTVFWTGFGEDHCL